MVEEERDEKKQAGGRREGEEGRLESLRCQTKVGEEIEPKGFNCKPFFPGSGRRRGSGGLSCSFYWQFAVLVVSLRYLT